MHQFYYEHILGDKDTFHHAWRALEAPFTMIPAPVGSAGKGRSADDFRGSTMVQHDMQGRPLFFHRNLQKWRTGFRPKHVNIKPDDAGRVWQSIKECRSSEGVSTACSTLLHYEDGLLAWNDSAAVATGARIRTVTSSLRDTIGWDVEVAIYKAFEGWFANPLYSAYIGTMEEMAPDGALKIVFNVAMAAIAAGVSISTVVCLARLSADANEVRSIKIQEVDGSCSACLYI